MEENSINHLKSLLGSFDANSKLPKITKIFEEVAIELFNKFHIQKGDQEYYFSNLEFYFCNQYHLDIITYPRQLPEGKWFFHQSGFDLTFASKYDIDNEGKINTEKEFYFGGILIREVIKKSSCKTFNGPYKCEWEIFDTLDALSQETSVPHIEPNEDLNFRIGKEIISDHRYFSYDDAKKTKKYNELKETYNRVSLSESDFIRFLNNGYAFKIKENLLKEKFSKRL
jgi:hypothetical protein